jgi:Na+/proline symporter
MWYLIVFVFSFAAPFCLRFMQDRISMRESHQALALSLVWLAIQLSTPARPSNNMVLAGWLFIYGFGSLVLLYGRMDKDDDKDGTA